MSDEVVLQEMALVSIMLVSPALPRGQHAQPYSGISKVCYTVGEHLGNLGSSAACAIYM